MFSLLEDTIVYQNQSFESKHLVWNLMINARKMIKSVYRFKHFDEYSRELQSGSENKSEVYWKASSDEKLIDFIKISAAFEAYNKAVLINEGVIVHKIDSKVNSTLRKKQNKGEVVRREEFIKNNFTRLDWKQKRATLCGFSKSLSTISYSETLSDSYQSIIRLDKQLIHELRVINKKRNRLHFNLDEKGAFEVSDHLAKWQLIKDKSLNVINEDLRKQEANLEAHDSLYCDVYFEDNW
jgi:hypothetical protein